MSTLPVRALPYDLLRVLAGHTVTLRDGVALRLYTAEEWLPLQHAACEKHDVPENKLDMARAVELTQPVSLIRRSAGGAA